ncbi:hypothetical protein M911_13825 [Ectothiorhodospira haloalkaliphila]|uniref:Porin domain-containing protein n=1 Tax=Ectothiorhodospira haloalkaliphila TaxID=421628 RepID=W8KLK9_9GAMM|nr:hypothetical protein M911_13825 [Ectothiorhodospira haloalkaliphila]
MGVPAAAAADTTLYGRLNVSLDFVDNGEDSSAQLASNSSRLGVRGSEDLGFAGLRGVYQIEAALQGAEDDVNRAFGGSDLTARNTYLGLAGNFGEVRLGKHDTPYKMATLPLNFFADTLGDKHHVVSRAGAAGAGAEGTFYRRLDNTLLYMSPDLDGLRFMGSYTTDRNDDTPSDTANDLDAFSLAATFNQGPMYLAVAYEQHNLDSDDIKAWKVGGTYQIQDLTLAAMYENIDLDFDDRDAFHLGLKYQLGQAYVMGSYTHAGELSNDDEAQMFAVGGGYDFTRRTGIYAVYAQVNNDDFGAYGLAGSGKGKGVTPDGVDQNVKGFQLGVTHNF